MDVIEMDTVEVEVSCSDHNENIIEENLNDENLNEVVLNDNENHGMDNANEYQQSEDEEALRKMDTSEVSMVRSAKGNDMLCVDNFLFHYEDRGQTTYRWICKKKKDKILPCPSRITTTLIDGDETKHFVQKVGSEHNHNRCSPEEIFTVFERKRIANLAGKPCTLENKTLKRKLKRIGSLGDATVPVKRAKKESAEWWLEDDSFYNNDDDEDEGEWPLEPELDIVKEEKIENMFVFEEEKVYMLKTAQGRQMICLDGLIYRLEGKLKKSESYRWECMRRSDVDCKARLYTQLINGRHIVQRKHDEEHTHTPFTQEKLLKLFDKNNIKIVFDEDCDGELNDNANVSTSFDVSKGAFEVITFSPITAQNIKQSNSPVKVNKCDQINHESVHEMLEMTMNEEKYKPVNSFPPTAVKSPKAKLSINQKLSHDPLAGLQRATLRTALRTDLSNAEMSFLPSAKGNKVLCLNNFIYHYDSRSTSNGHSYWKCHMHRNKLYKCNGRVTTSMSNEGPVLLKVSGTHSHPDSSDDIRRRLEKSAVAKNATQKSSEILHHNAMMELDDDLNSVGYKSKESIERRIGRISQKMKQEIDESNDFEPFVLDDTENNDDSMSSLSSALEFDDDHLDTLALPTKLEQMCKKVSATKGKTTETNSMTIKMRPKIEMDYEYEEDMGMQEEFLDCENENGSISAIHNSSTKDMLDVDSTSLREYEGKVRTRGRKAQVVGKNIEPDMDITKVSMMRSAKGGELLCVDGYLYHTATRTHLNTKWACIKNKNPKFLCNSRVTTQMTSSGVKVVRVTRYHTHHVDENDIKRRLYNELTKGKKGLALTLTPQQVLSKSLNELSVEYAELLANSKGAKERGVHATQIKKCAVDRPIMKLYGVSDGPPSLAVRMTLKLLKIPFELHSVDFIAAEHMSEDYAKMNPQKEIPVLDDDGFYLSESIAIMQYLCDKYAKETTIYPKDAKQRAIVNQRLCFNMGFYYASISAHAMAPIFFDYQRSEMSLKKVNNALDVFETYLKRSGTKYAAGDAVTIADFALVSATLCLEAIGFDLAPYPLVNKWYATFKEEYPDLWEIGNGGMQEIAEFEQNPPDLSHMNHPFHPTRKFTA